MGAMLSAILVSGCLEAPEASAALLDNDQLTTHGWLQVGDPEVSQIEHNITKNTVLTMSLIKVKYQDEEMSSVMGGGLQNVTSRLHIDSKQAFPAPTIITYRITMPGGKKLPLETFSSLMSPGVERTNRENNISSLRWGNTTELQLDNGNNANAFFYKGNFSGNGSYVGILGMVVTYNDETSSTMIIGFVPDGKFAVQLGDSRKELLFIDGRKELEEMTDLIQTVE